MRSNLQRERWLIASLIFVSTLLFVAGITIERRGGTGTETGSQEEIAEAETAETHTDAEAGSHEETAETHTGAEAGEVGHNDEAILGVSVENP